MYYRPSIHTHINAFPDTKTSGQTSDQNHCVDWLIAHGSDVTTTSPSIDTKKHNTTAIGLSDRYLMARLLPFHIFELSYTHRQTRIGPFDRSNGWRICGLVLSHRRLCTLYVSSCLSLSVLGTNNHTDGPGLVEPLSETAGNPVISFLTTNNRNGSIDAGNAES